MLGGRLRGALLLGAGVEVDWQIAPALSGVESVLPTNAGELVARVAGDPCRAIGLYKAGVYDTPGLH